MLNPTPLRAVVCAVLVLLAGGCTTGHGHTPEELGEMIADTVRATSGAPGLGVPDTAFDPARFLCEPAVDSPGSGDWRTDAPRGADGTDEADGTTSPGEATSPDGTDGTVELGLLPAEDTGDVSRAAVATGTVAATVIGPDGGSATAETDLAADEWTRLAYPDDFGADAAPGVHTVVWTDAGTGTPLACDGFTLESTPR